MFLSWWDRQQHRHLGHCNHGSATDERHYWQETGRGMQWKGRNRGREKRKEKFTVKRVFALCSTFRPSKNKFMTMKFNCAKLLYYNANTVCHHWPQLCTVRRCKKKNHIVDLGSEFKLDPFWWISYNTIYKWLNLNLLFPLVFRDGGGRGWGPGNEVIK